MRDWIGMFEWDCLFIYLQTNVLKCIRTYINIFILELRIHYIS